MACQWRIRHKLWVGLGLVIGILALMLAGMLKGLTSNSNSMKSIASKLAELIEAQDFCMVMTDLQKELPKNADNPVALRDKIRDAKDALNKYEGRLQDTLLRRRDPDKGRLEQELVQALRQRFAELDKAVATAYGGPTVSSGASPPFLVNDDLILNLVSTSELLRAAIYEDLYRRIWEARSENKFSLTVVVSVTVVGVLLMMAMLGSFYQWVFNPIRDLERGVGRVAQGDFEHRIEVHSRDEMEDLADAFNDMSGRLREMYGNLAQQVNERSRQLVRSERLASVGFLAAGVAHEINNPLASIAFCSEALERRLADCVAQAAPGDSEVIGKYLKMIQQEAFRCKTITQRLLEFSRTGERRREPTDLTELIQSVLDMVEHLQNYKGKHVVFHSPGRMVAWVNGQEIKSVVLNLVVDALDSMDEGGTLKISLGQRDRRAEIVFTDEGCGMTPEVLENIFEPFFTRSRTGKGTGLGLSISHRIITQHGGEIEAFSPGVAQGSTFTVRLPLQPAETVKEETLGHAAAA